MRKVGYEEMEALGKALSHGARIKLMRLLAEEGALSAGQLSERLSLSGGAITGHVKALLAAGLVRVDSQSGVHGVRHRVSLADDAVLLCLGAGAREKVRQSYEVEIPIGSFAEHEAQPTCGLATRDGLLGQIDDPRYFDDPGRYAAGVLWMMAGQVTYCIPNYVPAGRRVTRISIVQEISSEAPGTCGDWPSPIAFSLCGVAVGQWVSPGDYGDRRGLCNPPWYSDGLNQYGLRKALVVDERGTFMDGEHLSEVTVDRLPLSAGQPLRYRMAVESSPRGGGLTLFGKGFGNYGEHIRARVEYDEE